MKIEIEDNKIKFAAWAVSAAFALYFAANSFYIENHEMAAKEEDFNTRVLMAESTRYAEIAYHYRNELKTRELTEAEWARLELVEIQQCRIRNILADKDPELCD